MKHTQGGEYDLKCASGYVDLNQIVLHTSKMRLNADSIEGFYRPLPKFLSYCPALMTMTHMVKQHFELMQPQLINK